MSSRKESAVIFAAGAAVGAVVVGTVMYCCGDGRSFRTPKSGSPEEKAKELAIRKATCSSDTTSRDESRVLRSYDYEGHMEQRLRQNSSVVAPRKVDDDEEGSGVHEDYGGGMNINSVPTRVASAHLGERGAAADDDEINITRNTSIMEIREDVIREAAQERNKVVLRVPASSANMGPGYDCLGMALSVWSEVTMERAEKFEILYEGEGFEEVPLDETNLFVTGARAAFEAAGKPMPLIKYTCVNRIPYARGMGSSSAAIVAGLIGGLVLAGHKLPCWGHESLLQLACAIEGHPDNVAPVIYGGCQLGIHNNERWITERVQLPPGIQVVLFIPDFIGKTSEARAVLKDEVNRSDAVFSVGRVAWLVLALQSGNVNNLKSGCEDKIHQPQRGQHPAYKHVYPIIDAAITAGADGAYLSGAGPTVAAITSGASGDIFTQREKERVDKQVAEAMILAASKVGVKGEAFITTPAESGAYVVSAEPSFSRGTIRYPGDV